MICRSGHYNCPRSQDSRQQDSQHPGICYAKQLATPYGSTRVQPHGQNHYRTGQVLQENQVNQGTMCSQENQSREDQ